MADLRARRAGQVPASLSRPAHMRRLSAVQQMVIEGTQAFYCAFSRQVTAEQAVVVRMESKRCLAGP